jgi:hypothetical protein
MKEITDRNLIRQYLLGRLDEQAELEEKLSACIFTNEKMVGIVDSVEDEIIEDYLEGSLDPAEKGAVEKYFLQAPERKEKLRFMKLLTFHFHKEPFHLISHIKNEGHAQVVPWNSHFGNYGMPAILALVIVASLVYISGLYSTQERLESELAREKERSSAFGQQAELLQPTIVPLTLVADRARGAETSIPQLNVKPSTRRIMVEIALPGAGSGAFDVRLESKSGGAPFWSARVSPLISSNGDARLVFDVPVGAIQSGVYSFVVTSASSGSQSVRHYDFQAKVAN